eukprot:2896740-Rhodomonas_salina.1
MSVSCAGEEQRQRERASARSESGMLRVDACMMFESSLAPRHAACQCRASQRARGAEERT